jgi:hypothetical protein
MRFLYVIITFVLWYSLGTLGAIEAAEVNKNTELVRQPDWRILRPLPKWLWTWNEKLGSGSRPNKGNRSPPKFPKGNPIVYQPPKSPSDEVIIPSSRPKGTKIPEDEQISQTPIADLASPNGSKDSGLSSKEPTNIPSSIFNQPMGVEDSSGSKVSNEPQPIPSIRDGTTCVSRSFHSPLSNLTLQCATIALKLPGKVVSSVNSTTYNTGLTSYWAAQPREDLPSCFVTPSSSNEVSTVLKIINAANSIQKNICPFAIKGGGYVVTVACGELS